MKRTTFVSGAAGLALGSAPLDAFAGGLPSPAASSSAPPAHQTDEPYNLATETGVLYGSLRVPVAPGKPPIVLIVAGSGPTDRNGNAPAGVHADTYRLLADALETRGIATLRYDKRAIGASAGAAKSEADLRFGTYVDDAAAWLAKMKADGRFGRVAVAGHSEGSLIGILAAQRSHPDGFVSLCGAALPAATELRRQLRPKLAGMPELAQANDRILASLEAGNVVADVPTELRALYRASVQPYLISWFRIDPRAEIAKLTERCIVVGGGADLQVPLEDARALAAAQPAAKLVLVDGMSHVLKDATGLTPEQQAATVYIDPNLPVMPQAVDAVAYAVAPSMS